VWKLFVAGKSDAMASVPDWIEDVDNAGAKVRVIPADEYFPSMAQAIVASDDTIKEKPELIRKLVRATLHGLKDVNDDPAGAAVDYVKAVPQRVGQEKQMADVFALYKKYVYAGQKHPGEMDVKRLAQVQDFYVKSGIVDKATPINDLYTNEFVK
jgi:NitT/TauT family transport system substrate-binding protein